MEPITQAEHLRENVFRNLTKTKEWEIAKAADDFVVALGGQRMLPILGGVKVRVFDSGSIISAPRHYGGGGSRISQGDAAEMVLREVNKPLTVASLLERIEAKGATVGGERREINLSSSLSRDARFASIRIEGVPMWTLNEGEFPVGDQQPRALQPGEHDL